MSIIILRVSDTSRKHNFSHAGIKPASVNIWYCHPKKTSLTNKVLWFNPYHLSLFLFHLSVIISSLFLTFHLWFPPTQPYMIIDNSDRSLTCKNTLLRNKLQGLSTHLWSIAYHYICHFLFSFFPSLLLLFS